MNNPVIRARWSEPGPVGGSCLSCGSVIPESHQPHCQFPDAVLEGGPEGEPAAPDAGLRMMSREWTPPQTSWRRGYPTYRSGHVGGAVMNGGTSGGSPEQHPAPPPPLLGSWSSGSPVATRRSSFGEGGSGGGAPAGGSAFPPGFSARAETPRDQTGAAPGRWPGRQLPFSQPPSLRGEWSNRAQHQHQHSISTSISTSTSTSISISISISISSTAAAAVSLGPSARRSLSRPCPAS